MTATSQIYLFKIKIEETQHLTPLPLYSFSPHCSVYISPVTEKENFFDNQGLIKLMIISFFLLTSSFDSRAIMSGEIRSQSLLGV